MEKSKPNFLLWGSDNKVYYLQGDSGQITAEIKPENVVKFYKSKMMPRNAPKWDLKYPSVY